MALGANFIARRKEKQILLAEGGIRMTCPAAAGAQRRICFWLRPMASLPHKAWIFGHILGFDRGFWLSRTSSFLGPKTANSFSFNRILGSFRLNSIFIAFCADLPQPAGRLRTPWKRPVESFTIGQLT